MKIYSTDAIKALEDGTAIVSGAVFIDLSPAFRVWGGYGDLVIEGETFKGIGDKGLVTTSSGSLGSAENGADLVLSGVDPDVLVLIDAVSLRGKAVVLWELVFDGSGTTLLAANVALRGAVDRMSREDTPGSTSKITVKVEGAVRGLGRRGARMRTDADQRLFLGTDGGFRRVAYAGQKQLYLGGQKPASGNQAVGSSGPGVRSGAELDRSF